MKHILPLTYEPKILDVREGGCTQTIRPLNPTNQKSVDDWVMFHGWSDKPYRSKWNWRTFYWSIIEVIDVCVKPDGLVIPDPEHYLSKEESNKIARLDGFKDYNELYQQFVKMYGDVFNDPFDHKFFQVIRWDPNNTFS